LRFHTDARSEKIRELGRDPRIAIQAYDPAQKVQIRIEGLASIHAEDAVADAAWAGSREFSRACYAIDPGPGTPIIAPDAYRLDGDAGVTGVGRPDFRAVLVTATSLEWLLLAHSGHRRAIFDLRKGEGAWLAP
jgi:hypothetical protein